LEKVKGKIFDINLFNKLLIFVKPYNISFYGVLLSAIIISLLSTLTPYLLKIVVDDYILPKNYDGMQTIIMIMVGVLFLEVIFMYLFAYYANWLGQKVIKDLRVNVFEKIIKFKMSFFDKNAVGRLVTRTVNDIETIASIFSQGLFMIIADILKMLTVLIVMVIISWELTLVVISIFPLLIYATRVFQKTMKVAFEKVRKEVANLNSFVQERISGIKIVQIFSREEVEINNFSALALSNSDADINSILSSAVNSLTEGYCGNWNWDGTDLNMTPVDNSDTPQTTVSIADSATGDFTIGNTYKKVVYYGDAIDLSGITNCTVDSFLLPPSTPGM